MASAWGASWGSAWGNSWGSIAAPEPEPEPTPEVVAGGGATGSFGVGRYGLTSARDERKRVEIAEELKALYREIYETAKPDSVAADRAAAVVAEYAPTRAPDFPPPDVVDWALIASEGVAAVAALRNQLRDIQRELDRVVSDEDDIEILLLTM